MIIVMTVLAVFTLFFLIVFAAIFADNDGLVAGGFFAVLVAAGICTIYFHNYFSTPCEKVEIRYEYITRMDSLGTGEIAAELARRTK